MARKRKIDPNDFILQLKGHISTDPDVLAAKLQLAADATKHAQSIAPVDEGDYRDGIRPVRIGTTGVGVEFSDPKSVHIEYGTVDTPEFAVMKRTVEHFNGRR